MSREMPEQAVDPAENLHAAARTLLVFVAVGVFVAVRSFNAFAYPLLFCEDGPYEYAFYLMNRSPSAVFRFYEGYVSFIPNFCCYLISHLPPRVVPYAMSLYSLVLTCAAYSAFSLRRFRFLVSDDATRAAICVILALMPFEDFAQVSCANYSLWHVLLLLILFTLAPAPASTLGTVFQAFLVTLAVWSHPLSIVCVPICVLLLFCRKSWRDRFLNVWTVAVFTSYFFLGIEFSGTGKSPLSFAAGALSYTSHRVVFESLFSDQLRFALGYRGHSAVMWAVSLLVLLSVLALIFVQKDRRVRARFLAAFACIAAFAYGMIFLSLMARSISDDRWTGPWAQRYFYISKVFFVGFLLILVFHTLRERVASRGQDRFLTVLLMGYALSLSASDQFLFQTSHEEGKRVRKFIADFRTQLDHKSRGEPFIPVMRLDRGGRWDIEIDLRKLGPEL